MNNKFDQLAKSVAQSVTRRQALRRFGLGLATIALAGFALPSTSKAADHHDNCIGAPALCGKPGQDGLPPCSDCCGNKHACFDNPNTGAEECFCDG